MELPAESKKIYYNKPQVRAMLISANEEYHVWGRGTGKSSGVLAPRSARNAMELPRSLGLVVGRTYQQLLTQTLPSLMQGWEKLGLHKGVHYFVNTRPPKSWNRPEPFEPPLSYEHCIAFTNGSAMKMISQDRPGSSNGINSDWIIADEAKYLRYDKYLDETLPTMRANSDKVRKDGVKWKELPCHHSICMTTSMPTAADAKWILEKEKEMDPEKIALMFALNSEILKLRNLRLRAGPADQVKVGQQIARYERELQQLRFDTVFFSEASSLDNIEVLTPEYIKRMRRTMPDFRFNTEILNLRPDSVEGGFYPNLDLEKHGYDDGFDNAFLDSLDFDQEKLKRLDSRQDADCLKNLPLRGAVDWGAKISCLTMAQHVQYRNEYRFIKNMYVKHPLLLDDLAKEFLRYYRHHKDRTFFFIQDNEFGNQRTPDSTRSYNEKFADLLRQGGWHVIVIDMGRISDYQLRYYLWQKLLAEEDPTALKFRFNTNNCPELLTSMRMAPVEQDSKGRIVKDKRSERRSSVDPTDATHFSDTADLHALSVEDGILYTRVRSHTSLLTA